MVHPAYPAEAVQEDGYTSIWLRVVVTPEGQIKEITPQEGDNPFVDAATYAIRKWRFYPTEVDGQAVETSYSIHLLFDPHRKEGVATGVDLESPQPATSPDLLLAKSRLALDYESDTGGQVQDMSEDGVVAPKALYSPAPEFSEKSRKGAQHGTVTLFLVVETDGLPRDVKVVCSSIPDSDENALAAISRWRFAPATKDGQPVPFALLVDVSFKLY